MVQATATDYQIAQWADALHNNGYTKTRDEASMLASRCICSCDGCHRCNIERS